MRPANRAFRTKPAWRILSILQNLLTPRRALRRSATTAARKRVGLSFRGRPARSGIKPRSRPTFADAGEYDPIMQPGRTVLPELDRHRGEAVPRPMRRARHRAVGVLGRV